MIDTDEEMSEALNKYFLTVFIKERLERIYRGEEVGRLTNIYVSREDVIRQIEKLKATKASGPDGIFPRMLKSEISGHLREVFRKSLDTGMVPDSWRLLQVCYPFTIEYMRQPTMMTYDVVYLYFNRPFDKIPY